MVALLAAKTVIRDDRDTVLLATRLDVARLLVSALFIIIFEVEIFEKAPLLHVVWDTIRLLASMLLKLAFDDTVTLLRAVVPANRLVNLALVGTIRLDTPALRAFTLDSRTLHPSNVLILALIGTVRSCCTVMLDADKLLENNVWPFNRAMSALEAAMKFLICKLLAATFNKVVLALISMFEKLPALTCKLYISTLLKIVVLNGIGM